MVVAGITMMPVALILSRRHRIIRTTVVGHRTRALRVPDHVAAKKYMHKIMRIVEAVGCVQNVMGMVNILIHLMGIADG